MSQWTHVIGIIQTSSITKEDIEDAFGVPCTWHDLFTRSFLNHRIVDVKVPSGSEGSLNWHYIDTTEIDPDDNKPIMVVGEGALIAIEGDLRDFGEADEDIQEVANWFVEGCKKIQPRWATLSIDVEWGPQYNIDFKWNKWTIFKVERKQSLTIDDLHTDFDAGDEEQCLQLTISQ